MSAPAVTVTAPTLAGLTCAHLLRARGYEVGVPTRAGMSHDGSILLRPATAALLGMLWGSHPAELLIGAHPLLRRRVIWGGEESIVAQPGHVIAAGTLLERLYRRLPAGAPARNTDWTIATDSASAATLGQLQRFGARRAWVASARLSRAAAEDEAVLAQTDTCWAMLLPEGDGIATVHLVAMDGRSGLPGPVAALVTELGAFAGPFDAMPRLRVPSALPGTIAVGEAALGIDPLCGDGAGHALRGAWAAAEALIQASAGGDDVTAALNDYQAGLHFALNRHRTACGGHYGRCGGGWVAEAAPE